MRLSSDAFGLSCQWDNCHDYSSTPASSSSLKLDSINSLAGHLLHDHLGLQDGPGDRTVISANHSTLVDVELPAPVPDLAQDAEMRDKEQREDNKHQGTPLARNAKHDGINELKNERSPTTDEVKISIPAVGIAEKCCWRECERSFANVDDLMNHLSAVHVGSGKGHYECF